MPEQYGANAAGTGGGGAGLTLNVWQDSLPAPNRPGQRENANLKAVLDAIQKNSSALLRFVKTNVVSNGSDTIAATDYAIYSWRPILASGTGNMTVTITSPQEGMQITVHNYGGCGGSLQIGGCNFTSETSSCHGIIEYDNTGWHIVSVNQE
jgi:Fe-S cluster biogenesis protein NfuA